MQSSTNQAATGAKANKISMKAVWAVMGLLIVVELTSGVLQGYYTPWLTDIARHLGVHDADVNWFEGAQLMVSAMAIPILAKLGDLFGHKRILLVSIGVTAVASVALAFTWDFWSFMIAWAFQGFYVAWLPLLIALIYSRSRALPNASALTRKAAGILVAGLELGVIVSALLSGMISEPLIAADLYWLLLLLPGIAVIACFFVVLFGVEETTERVRGRFDTVGAVLLTMSLLVVTAGLSFIRAEGAESALPWIVIALGLLLLVPFVLWELRHPEPLIDIRLFRDSATWPIFLTAGLFGVSVLGAQAPLSTFARTDYEIYGYGLGVGSGLVSILIGVYVLSMVVGAVLFPIASRLTTPRITLIGASALIALGYFMFLPFHDTLTQTLTNMVIAGLGSGALVAALPAAAAAAAPLGRTGMATGLTNATKTIGGAFASAVFGLALLHQVGEAAGDAAGTAGSLSGYLTVWAVCGGTALLAAVALIFVPKLAFQDVSESGEPIIAV